jgi:23S rRNA U2552 (ribose-2'-O)-methylase RlmE/FtsJ
MIDLCAAPGSWSQVLSSRLYENVEDAIKATASENQMIVAVGKISHLFTNLQ